MNCAVDACAAPASRHWEGRPYCRKHQLRLKRRGDTDFEYRGATTFWWSGDAATYGAVHQRLYKMRGPVTGLSCIDCGRAAHHWSYDGADPDERTEGGIRYSTRLDHYWPRCVRCHKRFDLERLGRPVEQPKLRGENCRSAKLTEGEVRDIRAASAAGESSRALGRRYGVAKSTILGIVHRKKWAHI